MNLKIGHNTMSENYWLLDELATDNSATVESMKKMLKKTHCQSIQILVNM